MGRLKQRQITTLRPRGGKPTRYTDGLGLACWVTIGSRGQINRSWVQRLTIDSRGSGKDQRVSSGLGSCIDVSLKQAREQAYANWTAARRGENPFRRTAAHRLPTFEATARRWFDAKTDWKPASAKLWWGALANHVLPRIGTKTVDKVTRDDILGIVKPLWPGAQGRRVRGVIKTVLGAALARGHVEANLAENGQIDGELTGKRVVENHKSLPFTEAPAAYQRIAAAGAPEVATAAVQLLVLTALRSGEVRGLTWSEVDAEARVINIGAERMKANRPHTVPLSDAALAVIETMRGRHGEYVFPAPRTGQAIKSPNLVRVLEMAEVDSSLHGWRSTFRVWAGEQADYPREAAEFALAHTVHNKTEGAYARTETLLAQRVGLMTAWSEYVTGAASSV